MIVGLYGHFSKKTVNYACRWNAVRVLWFGNSNIVVVGVTDNHDKPSNCWINDFKLDFVDLFISIQWYF